MGITTSVKTAAALCLMAGGLVGVAGVAAADPPGGMTPSVSATPTAPPGPTGTATPMTPMTPSNGQTPGSGSGSGSGTGTGTGTSYVKYPWSSAIFAVSSGTSGAQPQQLTTNQWSSAGSPQPQQVSWISGSQVTRYDTSAQVFLTDPNGSVHPLTYAEWVAAGSPAPQQMTNQGYLKLSWGAQVFAMTNISAGTGSPMSAADWAAAGSPAPRVVPWIAGETWQQTAGSAAIYYSGPGIHRAVTFQEWVAAGKPAPHMVSKASA